MSFYIGIMSGTSLDGIDTVLIQCGKKFEKVSGHHFSLFPEMLRNQLLALQKKPECSLEQLGQMDRELAECYAKAVDSLLKKTGVSAEKIDAIGCHGQTIFHAPDAPFAFSIQIGDPNTLAAETGITVVSDFRRMDIALGGQGAPLVPAFHAAIFNDESTSKAVVNLGGIANTTLLRSNMPVHGFDNGPANCLMDAWFYENHRHSGFDAEGKWAKKGQCHKRLLDVMLEDDYFKRPYPKSTGREYFNLQWLRNHLRWFQDILPEDVQSTLCELTARVVSKDIKQYMPSGCNIYFCGGGTKNEYLMKRLKALLSSFTVTTTNQLDMPVEHMEAAAFAWLAYCRLNNIPGNIPSVTGATRRVLLGGVYSPSP